MNTKISITFLSVIIAIFAFTLLFPGPVHAGTYTICVTTTHCTRMCTATSAGCCMFETTTTCTTYTYGVKLVDVRETLSGFGVNEAGVESIIKTLDAGFEEESFKALLLEQGLTKEDVQAFFELLGREDFIDLPNPGLTPESPFYFFDRWGEAIQGVFAFSPEAKVRLQTALAAERIAEIQAILKAKDVELEKKFDIRTDGEIVNQDEEGAQKVKKMAEEIHQISEKSLEIAQIRLAGHAAKAVAIVLKEKKKGRDVKELAREVADSLYAQKGTVKLVFEKKEQEVEVVRSHVFDLYLYALGTQNTELRTQQEAEMNTIRNLKGRIKEKKNSVVAAFGSQNILLRDALDEEKRREGEARDAAEAPQEERKEAAERQTQLQEKEREKAIERFVQSLPRPSSLLCIAGWHEFLAGIDDQFAPPTSPAIPSAGLQLLMNQYQGQSHRDFDEVGIDKVFGHTFENIAPDPTKGTIEEAFLEFRIMPSHPSSAAQYNNDSINLLFTGPDGNSLTGGWTRSLYGTLGILSNYWSYHPAELVQLNLASLPNADGSTTNLISSLNAQDFLDLYIQDDTYIDYAKLRVRHSCFPLPSIEITEPIEPFCTEDLWRCTGWSACTPGGVQTRTCTLVTDCPGVGTPKPAEEQSCKVPAIGVDPSLEPICTEDIWECGRWGECSTAGAQTRTCSLGQDCPFAETPKPAESQTCVPPPPPKPPDLEAEKLLNSAFHFGSSGSFTITVGNVGSGPAASPITVTDELPAGLAYLSFSDPYSTYWSCSASGQKVTCVYSGSDLSPGGFLPTLIINVAVSSIDDFPAAGDQVVNCAIVEHPRDKNSGNNQGCASAVITAR